MHKIELTEKELSYIMLSLTDYQIKTRKLMDTTNHLHEYHEKTHDDISKLSSKLAVQLITHN